MDWMFQVWCSLTTLSAVWHFEGELSGEDVCIYIYILHLRCMRAFETPPKTNQGPSQRWDPPTIHVRDLPQMSETDLRRYEAFQPRNERAAHFVDFGVKTYVSIYQEPASGVGYSVPVPPMLFDPGMANSFTGIISIEYRISSINRTAVFKKASDYKLPAQSYEAPKSAPKKNENAKRIYTKHSSRAIFPCPGFPLSTTRPLCLVLRQSRHCQSRSAGGSGATWRLYPWGERIHSTFPNKISPTKNSCGVFCAMFMAYGLSHKLMAPKCFKKLLLLQSQRDKDTINLPSVPTPSIPSQKTKIHQQSHSWAISAPEASDCQKRCLCPVIHTSIFCTTSDGELWGKIMRFFIFGVCPPRMHWKKIFWDYKTPTSFVEW